MTRVSQSGSKNSIRDYRVWLVDEFSQRKQKNTAYSLRAFARDLGISATCLSEVLAKKRGPFLGKGHFSSPEPIPLNPLKI